jgi:hypothetical protein
MSSPVRLCALGLASGALAFPAIAATPGPSSAQSKASGIAGVWESPWPPDQLRQPGDPEPPQEVTPPPLKPQYLAAWKAQQKADADAIARGEPPVTGGVQCIPGGFPSMMGPVFPIEVLATPGQITIIAEAYSQVRRIYLNEKQIALDDAEPEFFGHSVGHWEGRTLVVDTIGLKDNVRMRGAPHSPTMRVDERLSPTSPTTFEDKVTVTDPDYLTGPWTWTWHYKRKPGYKINEFVCENNREYADPKTGGERLRLGN